MDSFVRYKIYSKESQGAILVMQSIIHLKGLGRKCEVLDYIKDNRWIDIQPEDLAPYPSSSTNEPRWRTFLAWAREHCAKQGYIDRAEHDCWRATTLGYNETTRIKQRFIEGGLNVQECFLWALPFKQLMCPSYSPQATDKVRPRYLWKDNLPNGRKSVRGNETDKWLDKLGVDSIDDLL